MNNPRKGFPNQGRTVNRPGHEVSMDSGGEVEQPRAQQLQSVLFASQGQGEILIMKILESFIL